MSGFGLLSPSLRYFGTKRTAVAAREGVRVAAQTVRTLKKQTVPIAKTPASDKLGLFVNFSEHKNKFSRRLLTIGGKYVIVIITVFKAARDVGMIVE